MNKMKKKKKNSKFQNYLHIFKNISKQTCELNAPTFKIFFQRIKVQITKKQVYIYINVSIKGKQ